MKFQFRVNDDFPPKKDGANSMWGKPTEARRLEKLRLAALRVLQGREPLKWNIRLSIEIHVGPVNNTITGDLDNFITGVCDGLMAADERSKLDMRWSNPELRDIHPSKPLGIYDDSEILSIKAEKVVGDTDIPWYEVILEGD
ncbi:MAG: hypothetical protein O8C66_03905 [Candidatus Methanoperedens sp.]|nr:hypothetical protein [Candidatus Methanoperedens sp.]MCZ7369631.1 hypothetical protein [Candidatus Methanoperedens sp.]